MRLAVIGFIAIAGCANQDPQVSALRNEVEQLKARLAAVEAEAAELRSQPERAALAAARARSAEAKARNERPAFPGPETLYSEALALEQRGGTDDAIKAYQKAARSGSGKAALRLGEIYDQGLLGVVRNYPESLKWFNVARVLGEDVPLAKSR